MALAQAQAKRRRVKNDAAPAHDGDLKNIETQEKILNPEAVKVRLCGSDLSLHALPAAWAFKFVGLAGRVLGAAGVDRGANIIVRVGSVLAETFKDDFLPYVARASNATSAEVSGQQIAQIVAEMDGKLSADDFLPLAATFMAMSAQNNVLRALGAPEPDAKN